MEKKNKSNQSLEACFCHLHESIVFEILCNLPVKALCKFKCVSKSWCSMFENQVFIDKIQPRTHLQLQIEDGSESDLHIFSIDENGSAHHVHSYEFEAQFLSLRHCEGLFCYHDKDIQLTLFNPATQDIIALPRWKDSFDFGFDPLSSKYKILGWKHTDGGPLEFMVLTLEKSPSWRPVGNKLRIRTLQQSVTSANGRLFWFPNEAYILYFDLAGEEFGVIKFPNMLNKEDFTRHLFNFDDSLCLVEQPRRQRFEILNLWILKDIDTSHWVSMLKNPTALPLEGTNLHSCEELGWTLQHSNFSSYYGEMLIAATDGEDQYIFSYCPLNGWFKRSEITELPFLVVPLKLYVQSSVNINEFVLGKVCEMYR